MADNRGRGRGRGRGDRGDRGGGSRGRGDMPYRPAGRGGVDRGGGEYQYRGGGRARGDRGGGRGGRGGGRGPVNEGPQIFRQGQTVPQPDDNVAKVEEGTAKVLAVSNQKRPLSQPYPDRPGYGTKGTGTVLYANCLPMTLVSKLLYRYHVNILGDGTKAAPAGKKARQIVRLLLEEHFSAHLRNIVTDYRSTVLARIKLPLIVKDDEKQTFDVRYKDEYDDEYPEGPRIFKVTLEQTGVLDPSELHNYLASCDANATLNNKDELIQALNLVMGHRPKTDRSVVNVGGNKHYSVNPELMEKFSLGDGIDAIRGFFVSARAAAARVVLNVQVKYAATYQAGPLRGLIDAFWEGDRRKNVFRLEKFLKRVRVQITHIQRRTSNGKLKANRVKAIGSLAYSADGQGLTNPPRVKKTGAGPFDVEFFAEAPASQPAPTAPGAESSKKKGKKGPKAAGPVPAGKYISVGEHFKKEYKIDVNPDYPVVNTGTRQKPSYLPVEACVVEPGQTFGSKIGPNQTAAMLLFAVRNRMPGHNAQSIVTKGVDLLGLKEGPNGPLASFGIEVGTDLITVQARVLPAPGIQYAKNKEMKASSGSWNMREVAFSKPARVPVWTYLVIEQGRPIFKGPDHIQQSLNGFATILKKMGVDIPHAVQGKRVVLTGIRDEDSKAIDNAVRELQAQHNGLSLILGVLHGKETATYNTIKQICDVRRGVKNINVQADKFAKGEAQYFANVGLKVNLKFGGVNQSLRSSDLGFFGDGKTMLVGIDVTHPSPGSAGNAPSVAAIVASIDSSLGQWPAKICIQTQARNEMVEDLKEMMQSRLKLWAKHNKNQYPENIVVYRDGVSEGQYSIVIEKELPLLKAACAALYPPQQQKKGLPRLSIIVVGKRHNIRFYPTDVSTAERSMNPRPGTVVDRGISDARVWDFYLQAHHALQGTARPAHYFTIWDEIFYPKHPGKPGTFNAADTLQDLTHKMCYMFGRATKAVSVCPPAYYADLVCTRARCYLADLFDPESSPEGSVATGGTNATVDNSRAVVHPSLADSMFYI